MDISPSGDRTSPRTQPESITALTNAREDIIPPVKGPRRSGDLLM
jgi:hypothetical protein